jgi:hypothetical protein
MFLYTGIDGIGGSSSHHPKQRKTWAIRDRVIGGVMFVLRSAWEELHVYYTTHFTDLCTDLVSRSVVRVELGVGKQPNEMVPCIEPDLVSSTRLERT